MEDRSVPSTPLVGPPVAPKPAAPLFMLCPPRSFSTVISAILGQHPALYSFPELNLFAGRTLEEVARYQRGVQPDTDFPPGLLRALAEMHHNSQSFEAIDEVQRWLDARRSWSSRKLFDYLRYLVHPRIVVDKSPRNAMSPWCLDNIFLYYPDARFIHLTRHPVSGIRSLLELWRPKMHEMLARPTEGLFVHRCARIWHDTHRNILEFLRELPAGQSLRVRGEDLMTEPDVELRRLLGWLEVRDDEETIAAMKRPEDWPYAMPGPVNARYANDAKFMHAPTLRPIPRTTGIALPPEWDLEPGLAECIVKCASQLGYS